MTAKEYLLQYKRMKMRIHSVENALEELETQAASISINLDGMPHGTEISDKTGRLAAAMADKENEWIDLRAEAFRVMVRVSDVIAQVEDEERRWLLTMRYINDYTWERIAVEMDFTYQWVAGPLHGSALQEVEKVLEKLKLLDSN